MTVGRPILEAVQPDVASLGDVEKAAVLVRIQSAVVRVARDVVQGDRVALQIEVVYENARRVESQRHVLLGHVRGSARRRVRIVTC